MLAINVVFSGLAVFHLTYLGSMFDPGVDEQEAEQVRDENHRSFPVSPHWAECAGLRTHFSDVFPVECSFAYSEQACSGQA